MAHHLSGNTIVEVKPREWDAVVVSLDNLIAKIRIRFPVHELGYAIWQKKAIKELLAGTFVWLDEFEAVFRADRENVIFLVKRRGDDELTLSPMLDAETEAIVMEGFDEAARTKAGLANAPEVDQVETTAAMFDLVKIEQLEKMFPSGGQWKVWAERAKVTGLDIARTGRAQFNPYRAAMWFLKKGLPDWDLARCHRVLANNLPSRSRDKKHLFVDDRD